MKVVLADYGAGNLRSVCAALERAGAEPSVSADPAALAEAPLALVAGVGHAGRAAAELERRGLADALRERAARERPLFGICLGLQLLFGRSEEGGEGLGLLAGQSVRVRARHVPHMGWNELLPTGRSEVVGDVGGEDVYFAHSFAVSPAEPVTVAEVEHDGRLVAAVERGPVAGVQFHPERSGPVGRRVLANVLAWSRSA